MQTALAPRRHLPTLTETEAPSAPTFPVTWYQVAWSTELPKKGIKPVVLCGRHLVVYRGEDGQVYALDAHCPHLGAHLGVKGTVCGTQIRCAFHGWEFSGAGKCTKIPVSDKIPPTTSLRSWRVVERYGIVFVHYDPNQQFPDAPPPNVEELNGGEWGAPIGKAHVIHAQHSEILENGVDTGHFFWVHGVPMDKPVLDEEADGSLCFRHRTVRRKLGLNFDTMMAISYPIPGLQIVRLDGVLGRKVVMLSSVTPTVPGTVVAHLTTRVSEGLAPALVTDALTRVVAHLINTTFAEDIPIWDNKIYRDRPVLTRGDETITKFRRWYGRFPVAAGVGPQLARSC